MGETLYHHIAHNRGYQLENLLNKSKEFIIVVFFIELLFTVLKALYILYYCIYIELSWVFLSSIEYSWEWVDLRWGEYVILSTSSSYILCFSVPFAWSYILCTDDLTCNFWWCIYRYSWSSTRASLIPLAVSDFLW